MQIFVSDSQLGVFYWAPLGPVKACLNSKTLPGKTQAAILKDLQKKILGFLCLLNGAMSNPQTAGAALRSVDDGLTRMVGNLSRINNTNIAEDIRQWLCDVCHEFYETRNGNPPPECTVCGGQTFREKSIKGN